MLDIIIKNGMIVDGQKKPAYISDIGIVGEKIVKIGNLGNVKGIEEINASNLIVAPGFIDSHTHADLEVLTKNASIDKVTQGITTQIIGNCGFSVAPLNPDNKVGWKCGISEIVGKYMDVDWTWNSFGDYLSRLKGIGLTTNIYPMVGYGAVRNYFSGLKDVKYGKKEIGMVKSKIVEAFDEGARGISFGLIYVPTLYAANDEILEISKLAAKHDQIITFHMRNEGDYLVESVKEIIEISRLSHGNIEISHFKALGRQNWGKKISTSLELIERANNESCFIGFDQYPYTAASTYLKSVLPPWVANGGNDEIVHLLRQKKIREKIKKEFKKPSLKENGWDNFIFLVNEDWNKIKIVGIGAGQNEHLQGKSLKDIAIMRKEEPEDAILNLLIEENCNLTGIFFLISEDDIIRILQNPFHKFGSDSIYNVHPHPRRYGSFPKIIRRYVREEKKLNIEEAIYKMTYSTAAKFNIKGRGIIQEGKFADIAIFDLQNISDESNFDFPDRYSKGIELVIINGQIVYKNNQLIKQNGRIL